jgi:hypothetical protein
MKPKSYVLLAASGLIAATCAFAAPAFADDISNSMYPPDSNTGAGVSGPVTQPAPGTLTGNTSDMSNPSSNDMTNAPSDDTANSPSNDMATPPSNDMTTPPSNDMTTNPSGVDMNNNNAVSNPDDGNTPDTATGDDDY